MAQCVCLVQIRMKRTKQNKTKINKKKLLIYLRDAFGIQSSVLECLLYIYDEESCSASLKD